VLLPSSTVCRNRPRSPTVSCRRWRCIGVSRCRCCASSSRIPQATGSRSQVCSHLFSKSEMQAAYEGPDGTLRVWSARCFPPQRSRVFHGACARHSRMSACGVTGHSD
jgi:hypothetical protein